MNSSVWISHHSDQPAPGPTIGQSGGRKSDSGGSLSIAGSGQRIEDCIATGAAGKATRRRLIGGTVAAGAATAAACGPGGPAAPGGSADRKARLAIAYWTTQPEQNELRQRPIKLFREKHPHIEVEEITAAGAGGLGEKMLSMLAAGTPPDVVNLGDGGAPDLASRGAFLTLDDRIKRDRGFRWDDFWQGPRTAGQYEGAQVALPNYGINAALLYFNRELFTAAGRSTPDTLYQRQQLTWEMVLEESTRLTRREPAGTLMQAGLGYPWTIRPWILLLLRGYGADYLDKDGSKVVINTPQAVQALRVAYELGPRRKVMPLRGEGNSVDLVRAGQVAQAIYWMGAASWWRATSFDWDVAPTPAGPAARATYGIPFLLAIFRDTREADAAWRYATFTLSPEMDAQQAADWGYMTLRQSSVTAWRQRMGSQKPRNLNLVEETAKALRLEPINKPHPQLAEVDRILSREVQALFFDGKPPEQVVQVIATEGNALLGAR